MIGENAKRVVVLGINGRIGQEVARAFVAAGYETSGMGREDRVHLTGVRFVQGDAANAADIRRAVDGADIVVNALNLPYDKWDKGRSEAQLAGVLEALRGSGKLLMFPGNIYNYAASQHVLSPETPFHPQKDKGEIRVRMEQMLKDASARGDVRVCIIRSGDFFAPHATGSMFDLALMRRKKDKVFELPMKPDMKHTWAYLPDLARVYVKLAEKSDELVAFQTFHYRGYFVTGDRLVDALQASVAAPWKIGAVPWNMLGVIGWFVPVVREVVKMSYLFRTPHELVDPRLDAILGPDFNTPFDEAIAKTVRSYLEDEPRMFEGKAVAAA
ncbi:MAG: NAD-dependent epimerase/dehydratase family protein [Hyphomicrobiaceae bacterium]|nr:NAD-dependent epimerase/dehydratase family protein [Hyphomicrobiaceae bacterium]MCC0023702.1 NAD-dependent epimerase/dehydratase family protein [Hyphomicrobiaceae bacterium]